MSAATHAMSRRDMLLGGALLATAGVTWARMPRQRVLALTSGSVADAIPTKVGGWRAVTGDDVVQPSEDEQRAAAPYEDQVTRTFVDADGVSIMFVLAYDRSQSGMLMVHRPESCYPGSGFTITADRPVDIPLAPGLAPRGRFLSTRLDTRIEQVLYWTRLGDEFPQSWDEERRFLAVQNLRGLTPDGALARLSCIDADAGGSRLRLMRFAAALSAAANRNGRALLGGPATASPGRV